MAFPFRLISAALICLGGTALARADYPINNPTQQLPNPVYLTQPVEGSVDVRNLPEVQDVRIVGGKQDEPLEVKGDVGLKVTAPIPVVITNAPNPAHEAAAPAPVKIDDTQPVRVWIDNAWNPESPVQQEFAAFAFQGRFSTPSERHRRLFNTAPGRIFHLTDLVVDGRPEGNVRVRLVVRAQALVGRITGAETGEAPVAVLDLRTGAAVRLGTAVPIAGDFAVDVEGVGQAAGSPFSAMAIGYLTRK